MRKVLTTLPRNRDASKSLVVFDGLTNNVARDRYFGVEITNDKTGYYNRGYITSNHYVDEYSNNETTRFNVRSLSKLTVGNGWDADVYIAPTLLKLIDQLLSYGKRVYQFDTPKELMNWVLEGPVD